LRWLSSLAVVGVVVLLWEGSKALFAIPRYKLPHVHEILAEFL
jgi:ABC-type nitrate/sulfonate/bicarbonate transport system permease component